MSGITIQQSMHQFADATPNLKYTFFGGKGGVGKTVLAGAAAVAFAQSGKRTLLASTNPVHSVSGMLDQNVFGSETQVEGVPNLWAYEIDTKDTIERSKVEIRGKADEFIESATMNPAFEESAMFENMIDLMFADKYDLYVFDTAPTANARRLLGMSSVYSLWVNKMMESRKEAQQMRISLSYSKKAKENEKDPLMDYLLEFQSRMAHAKELLTDPAKTAFFFVTLPEALPIAVIRRFINWFHEFGIPVGGVVVNMLIDKEGISKDADQFVLNRVAMQDEHMVEIKDQFNDMVRCILPLFETEIRGVEMLKRTANLLFASGEAVSK